MSKLEKMNFEKKLAEFAAPTLLGIKCGGLMSLSPNEFDLDANLNLFNGKAFSRGLKMRRLCCCGERSLIFIYNEALLKKHLAVPETARLLKGCGYNDLSPDVCLETLSERIKSQEDFPHEIGIFLGTPLRTLWDLLRTRVRISSYAAAVRSTETLKRQSGILKITQSAGIFCPEN